MISKPCVWCQGRKYLRYHGSNEKEPCVLCKGSDGESTGRICILSTEELEQLDFELVGQKDPRTEAIWSDVVEEMTLRKKK